MSTVPQPPCRCGRCDSQDGTARGIPEIAESSTATAPKKKKAKKGTAAPAGGKYETVIACEECWTCYIGGGFAELGVEFPKWCSGTSVECASFDALKRDQFPMAWTAIIRMRREHRERRYAANTEDEQEGGGSRFGFKSNGGAPRSG